MAFQIQSPAFANGAPIPAKFTCDGSDVSPALAWMGAPPGTKSFVLVCEDPDAPGGTWVHWVIYAIPSKETGLAEGVPPAKGLPNGAVQGANSWRRTGYGGPCPPRGKPHRYFFRLYALNTDPRLGPGATTDQLFKAIESRILGQAELMGTYGRS